MCVPQWIGDSLPLVNLCQQCAIHDKQKQIEGDGQSLEQLGRAAVVLSLFHFTPWVESGVAQGLHSKFQCLGKQLKEQMCAHGTAESGGWVEQWVVHDGICGLLMDDTAVCG